MHRWYCYLATPGYYRRFGFEPAGTYGVFRPPGPLDNPHFMVRRLGHLDEGWRGAFTYWWRHVRGRILVQLSKEAVSAGYRAPGSV